VEITLVNPNPKWTKSHLIEPTPLGYIHIGIDVEAPTRPGPVLRTTGRKKALLGRLKELGKQLQSRDDVERVTVFRAVSFMPPGNYIKEHPEVPAPQFDVVVLVETVSVDAIEAVQASDEYAALLAEIESGSRRVKIHRARNLKRVADVDKTRQGLFVFNHLIGDDPDVVVENWEWMGGWYAVETGLNNSTLLFPLDKAESDYVAINNARWETSLPRLSFRQMRKRSFWNYVVANLEAHKIGAWPVFYRLA
jgi:hypothetical protein